MKRHRPVAAVAALAWMALVAGCLAMRPLSEMIDQEVYKLKCGTRCHPPHSPAKHSDTEWRSVVHRM
ncbi:MAG: hypothetical protein QGH20_08900, partial [Candidatus Latescibacteria bacterium]|nr:hypothetical protein [Candidatus Latescibacterota bacterium]